jgi:membrane associated rhomboid family serine protease
MSGYRYIRPFQRRNFNAAFILIAVNVAVFLLQNLARNNRFIMINFAMIPLRVDEGAFWQFLTYMFLHADVTHLVFNMLGLFFFGVQVEERMGSLEFLAYYLLSGLCAGIISYFVYSATGGNFIILIGASGAVYAVLLAFATYFPSARMFVMGMIPLRAPLVVLLYAGIEIFSQLTNSRSGVAHLTHLGGLAAGWLYLLLRLRINPIREFFGGRRY